MIRAVRRALLLFALLPGRMALAAACDDPAGAPVAAVVVSGAETVADADVRTALGVKPGNVVTALALTKLEDAVLALGWFERVSVVLVSSDEGCALRVRVDEYGPVKEIRFEGVTAYEAEALRAALETKAGAPANLRAVERDASSLTARYQDEGYEAARVSSWDVGEGVVTFRVSEGTIARIDVRGARITGRRRVRKVLGIEPGAVYSSKALVAGQAALYRTGLFSAVGFGVEPLPAGANGRDEEQLVLTVNVTEYRNPFSRTEVFAGQGSGAEGEERGLSATSIEARIRNVGGGNSLRLSADVVAPAPDGLAQSGFDEFYRVRGRADFAFFRPEESAGGGLAGLEAERVRGRHREDLGLTLRADSPAISAGIELPVVQSERVLGLGGFAGTFGWRDVWATPEGSTEEVEVFDGAAGRGEVSIDLRESGGLGLEPSNLRVRAGLEMHDGLEPFSFATAQGRFLWRIARGQRVELSGDATLLSGDVPFWRETALGGREGPFGYGREFAFARRHARGRVEYAATLPQDLLGAGAGISGAAWSGANGGRGTGDAESAFFELRVGPEFARLRAGVALPLPAADREPWFYAGVVVATPY